MLALNVEEVEVYGDSTLVIAQVQNIWKTKEEHLKPYQSYLEKLALKFEKITFTPLPRSQNQFADALATLASLIRIPERAQMQPLIIQQSSRPAHEATIMFIEEEFDDGKPWYFDVLNFLE